MHWHMCLTELIAPIAYIIDMHSPQANSLRKKLAVAAMFLSDLVNTRHPITYLAQKLFILHKSTCVYSDKQTHTS